MFGEEDYFILKTLQRQINDDPDAVVFDLMVSSWVTSLEGFDSSERSPIIAILLPRVQKNRTGFRAVIDAEIAKCLHQHLTQNVPRLTLLLALVCGPSQDATMKETSNLPSCVSFLLRELRSEPLFLSLYSTNFVFRIGRSSFPSCGWLLYLHWPWFRRLIDSGLQESQTRIITLPQDSFTGVAALTILDMMQFGHMDSFAHLSDKDAISILEHAAAFDLVNIDEKALSRVKPLIDACEARVYPLLTPINCWNQLRIAHSIGSSRCKIIHKFILETVKVASFEEMANLPEDVVLDMIRLTKRNLIQKA